MKFLPKPRMATTEHTINDALAELLRGTRRAWRDSDIVSSENTGQLKGSNARPDILVVEPNVSPVVIETEVFPAMTVEVEAVDRLGKQLKKTGRPILSSIAVRLPIRLRQKSGKSLQKELASATDLEMVLYTGSNPSKGDRFPKKGWMVGTVADLSILTQSATVPPDVIDAAVTELVNGVSETAGMLTDIAKENGEAIEKIAKQLFQEDGEQTRRMAATILANAFVFHESLAGKLKGVNSIDELRGSKKLTKAAILAEWQKILKVNYWPIFDIARRALEVIPVAESKYLIERLAETADKLLENRLMRSHDLTGAVFQRMIVDRKFLAAYYTTPASAALLLGLALVPEATPDMKSWSDPENVKSLRIADFACGTGTLLTTAYSRVGQLHELAGGDSEAIHAEMMAHAMIGCDVLPSAAHLTASMIAGAHPTVKYDQSLIMTVPYGNMDGDIALGSLDLINPQAKLTEMAITAKAAEGMGEKEKETWAALPHASFDLVVMNPPFVRPTNHEGGKHDVPNPMFAAFANSKEEQKKMAEATKRLTAGTSAHGNAGEASIFLVLADRKVKEGGIVALVMPLSLMLGESWEGSRLLLTKNYSGLVAISIAGATDIDSSFSADTDMAECLVIARKSKPETNRATFVVLKERPLYPLLGAGAAVQIHRLIDSKNFRRLEDGPVGGTQLHFGDDVIGYAMDAPLPEGGAVWNLARIADLSLAQASYQLANESRLWLPGMDKSETVPIAISTIEKIGETGPIHRDINGTNPDKSIRGPFEIKSAEKDSVPTYPVLWSHDADRERTMSFEGDTEGLPLKGATEKEQESIDQKIAAIWASASHCHFNCDFRFNSQSTAMQFTPRRTIGGVAWLAIKLPNEKMEKALVLWANTSLGFLLRWWHSNKQQSGRGRLGKTMAQSLPVLDITSLNAQQIERVGKIFDEMCEKPLLPLHEIDHDPVRKELDERFAREVLSLPESMLQPDGALDVLRKKLAQEPSIRGNK